MGEKDPKLLTDMAQVQLDVGLAALANDPELTARAKTMFEHRVTIYPDMAPADELLAQYDFTNPFSRIAFAIACLPELLRNRILHDVYKALCVWVGKSGVWTEGTPGQMLLNGRERLGCCDTAIDVMAQAEQTIRETCPEGDREALLADYELSITGYLRELFAKANEQLETMRKGIAVSDDSGLMAFLRKAMQRADHEDEGTEEEEEESKTSADELAGAHPWAGTSHTFRHIRHPTLRLNFETARVVDWAARTETTEEMWDDWAMREHIYGLPHDGKILLVEIVTGDNTGTELLVHETELVG